jgi:hypothetical protein
VSKLHCSRLDVRRDALCERTIKKGTDSDGNRLSRLLFQTRENVIYVILTTGRRSNVELTVLNH